MRALRLILLLLALAATGLWVIGYLYINALGCAFVTNAPAGGCRIDMPWQQRGEDLVLFVLVPGAVVLGIWVLVYLLWRGR